MAIGRTVKNDVFLRIFTCLQAPLGGLGAVLRRPGAVLWRRRGVLRLLCGCETVKSDVKLSKIIEAAEPKACELGRSVAHLAKSHKNDVFLRVFECSWAFLERS